MPPFVRSGRGGVELIDMQSDPMMRDGVVHFQQKGCLALSEERFGAFRKFPQPLAAVALRLMQENFSASHRENGIFQNPDGIPFRTFYRQLLWVV